VIVAPAAKNAASKNHLKDILRDKNHLCGIVIVHLTLNVVFKTRKHFQMAGYGILKQIVDLKFCLTAPLPDHIRKPRCKVKHGTATILQHNNKLTSEMYLLGFRQVWGLCA